MKELLVIPIIAITLLSIATQLVDTAEQSGQKAVAYAQEMNSAVDCAFLGKPLSECSPELLNTDFKEDLNDAQKQIADVQEELQALHKELEESEHQAN
ncbi:MAG: hypothetical protein KC535_02220 [Nanoarchaeota archaeon]|nr:hypothetical protein [Nanoarchaeota archaeon]